MSENLIYADLNLTESSRPRLQKDTNIPGSTYAELKVQSLDTSAVASCASSVPTSLPGTASEHRKRVLYSEGGQTVEQVAQRGRGVSICGDIQHLTVLGNLFYLTPPEQGSRSPSGQTGVPDITNFNDSRRGKSCCSRTCVAILIAVIILLLILGVGLIFMYHPTTSSPHDRETFSSTYEKAQGCPQHWKRYGKKCYFFSQIREIKDLNTFRKECDSMYSDLVTIDSKEELMSLGAYNLLPVIYTKHLSKGYLISQSMNHYYLLGLQYSAREKKWKWINDKEYSTDMLNITGPYSDYFCSVVGFGKVSTASCNGSSTTQNMCEKAASISEQAEGGSQTAGSGRNLTPSFV